MTYDGIFTSSAQAGTFSAVMTPVARAYNVDTSTVTVTPPGRTASAACTDVQLTVDTYRLLERADTALSGRLQQLVPAGSWRGQPLTQ